MGKNRNWRLVFPFKVKLKSVWWLHWWLRSTGDCWVLNSLQTCNLLIHYGGFTHNTHTHRMVVTGPMTHYLYQFLEAVVPKRSQLSSLRKVILERLLFAPPYLLALFYTVAILEVTFPSAHFHQTLSCTSSLAPRLSHCPVFADWKQSKTRRQI